MLKSLLPLDEEYFIKLLAGNSMISKVFERAVYA